MAMEEVLCTEERFIYILLVSSIREIGLNPDEPEPQDML
jgi:hypothetical protein